MTSPFEPPARPVRTVMIPWPREWTRWEEGLLSSWVSVPWLSALLLLVFSIVLDGLAVIDFAILALLASSPGLLFLARWCVHLYREREPRRGIQLPRARWTVQARVAKMAFANGELFFVLGIAGMFMASVESDSDVELLTALLGGVGVLGVFVAVVTRAVLRDLCLDAMHRRDAAALRRLCSPWMVGRRLARRGKGFLALGEGRVHDALRWWHAGSERSAFHLAFLGEGTVDDHSLDRWPKRFDDIVTRLHTMFAHRFLAGEDEQVVSLYETLEPDMRSLTGLYGDEIKLLVVAALCRLARVQEANRLARSMQAPLVDAEWVDAVYPQVGRALAAIR